MPSYIVTQLAADIRAISAKLTAMYADATLPGGHPDQDITGDGTIKNTQWRESLQNERARLIEQLHKLGYQLDADGNPESTCFEIVTEATT